MEKNVSATHIERLKKMVPRGRITIATVEPIKGLELHPLTTLDLGLPEKKAA